MAAQPDVLEGEVTALTVPEQQHSPLVMPAVDAAGMKRAMAAYTDICKAVLEPSDYQKIGDKTFKKRSAWQKLATAFSVSAEIVDKVVHLDDDGRVLRAEFVVRATAPNGRHEDGYGAASRSERQFSKPDHDIPATAETRARNRACANLFAFGEMTAEEIDGAAPVQPSLSQGGTAPRGAAPSSSSPPAPTGKNLVRYRRPAAEGDAAPNVSASPSGDHEGGSTAPSASSSAPTVVLDHDQQVNQALEHAKEFRTRQAKTRGVKLTKAELGEKSLALLDGLADAEYGKPFDDLTTQEVLHISSVVADKLAETSA